MIFIIFATNAFFLKNHNRCKILQCNRKNERKYILKKEKTKWQENSTKI